MTTTADEARAMLQLRDNAEIKIQAGIAPPTQGWTLGAAALTLLHRLASDPITAGDALKLLHELQVHQVELDMQHEHMEADRWELQQRADHYAELYEFAPAANFKVDKAGRIIEGNLAAARMLGLQPDDLGGRDIVTLAATESGPAIRALLGQTLRSGVRNRCKVLAGDGSGWLEVAAIAAPGGRNCLMVATALTDAPNSARDP